MLVFYITRSSNVATGNHLDSGTRIWPRPVTDFERLEICKGLQQKMSNLEQRMTGFDETYSRPLLEINNERDRVQRYMDQLDDEIQIDRLTMALRDAEDQKERERERQQVLVARLRASVCSTNCGLDAALIDRWHIQEIKRRAQIKQLKKDLKSERPALPLVIDQSWRRNP